MIIFSFGTGASLTGKRYNIINTKFFSKPDWTDFKRYYDEARQAILSDEEIDRRVISDVFRMEESTDDYQDEAELEAEREKYWKCPKCLLPPLTLGSD